MSCQGTLGAFAGIDNQGVTQEGARQVALSRWRFAKDSCCYRLSMVAEGEGWRVIAWGEAKDSCK